MNLSADNKTVHGLWIGNKLSQLELLTINSFLKHGHEFCLWVYEKPETELPKDVQIKDASDILPKEKIFRYKHTNQFGHGKDSLGGFSDIFRYKLLYELGGWWTDMDVCCLKPLQFEEPYVFRNHHKLKAVGNLIKCPAECELMKLCFDQAAEQIDENNRDWHKPINIFIANIMKLELHNHIVEISNPDSWNYIRKMLFKNMSFPDHWHAIHWVNEEWNRYELDKNRFLPKSTIWNLLGKNGMSPEQLSAKKARKTRYKLGLVYSAFVHLPWMIKSK